MPFIYDQILYDKEKQDMVQAKIAWAIALTKTSLPATEKDLSYLPFNLFQILSFTK